MTEPTYEAAPEPAAMLWRDADLEALKAELIARDREIIRLSAERDRYKPTVDVSHMFFTTEDDVRRVYPDDTLRELVMAKIDAQNRKHGRSRPLITADQPGIYDSYLADVMADLLRGGLGSVHDGPWTRKLKFAKPNAVDAEGNKVFDTSRPIEIVGLPLEPQVNNTAGSLADGIVIYTSKGYKLTEPFLCPAGPCFRAAALDDRGRWRHEGYCSQEHHDMIEDALRQAARRSDSSSMVGLAIGSVR